MYQSGIDEQLISKQTGHRSLAIRAYKRPSSELEKDVSSVIQGAKKPCAQTVSVNPDKSPSTSCEVSVPTHNVSSSSADVSVKTGKDSSTLSFTFNINLK
jgi:hypothetical protein